jgi:hypothetical protein
VVAEVSYGHELVQAGGTDTFTIDLINNGPGNLDDSTKLGLEISLPQHTTNDGTVVEDVTGNAPSGRNSVASTQTRETSSVFLAAPNGGLYGIFAAGSYGNGKTFRSYTLTLHIDPNVTASSQLNGGGVTVTTPTTVSLLVAPPPLSVRRRTSTARSTRRGSPGRARRRRAVAAATEAVAAGATACRPAA